MKELMWFSWLFPLLFILHDMEEIITAKTWCAKGYKKYIPFPITPFGNTKSTQGFAVAVYEELVLWCMVTLIGNLIGFYGLWYGFFVVYTLHLAVLHILLLPLSYRRYVPGQVTAWLTLIPCCFVLRFALNVLNYSIFKQGIWILISIILLFANMKYLHKRMNHLANWIKV